MARVLETPVQQRFSDIDPFMHVNNVAQQAYFDVGKVDFYRKVLGAEVLLGDLRIVTVSTSTSYIGQVRLYDDLLMSMNRRKERPYSDNRLSRHAAGTGSPDCRAKLKTTMTERLSERVCPPTTSRWKRVMLLLPTFSQVVSTRTSSYNRTCPM